MKANEVMGGMSFSLLDFKRSPRINGWFKLLPYKEGCKTYAEEEDAGAASQVGTIVVASSGKQEPLREQGGREGRQGGRERGREGRQ